MAWYSTQSHYPDTKPTSPCVFVLILSTKLWSNKSQFDKSLVWLDREPSSHSPALCRLGQHCLRLRLWPNSRTLGKIKACAHTLSFVFEHYMERMSLLTMVPWRGLYTCWVEVYYLDICNHLFGVLHLGSIRSYIIRMHTDLWQSTLMANVHQTG